MREKLLQAIVLTVVWCHPARAQINSGTIVVFQVTSNGLIIAADSRGVSTKAPPNDMTCKIAALKNHFVFAATGGYSYSSGGILDTVLSWDNIEEARRIAELVPLQAFKDTPGVEVDMAAGLWAKTMLSKWEQLRIAHPEIVTATARKQGGGLVNGFFAVASGGDVAFTGRSLVFDGKEISITQIQFTNCTPCAAGVTDIFTEFTALASPRAHHEFANFTVSKSLLSRMSVEMLRAIRLADLTVAYDKSGLVGGDIDALELHPDGRVVWVARKENCPEN